MSTLHLLSHSPFGDDRLNSCLRLLSPGDGLLLCGEAVQALRPGSQPRRQLDALPDDIALHALDEDLLARGLTEQLPARLQRLDYPAFVACSLAFDKVNSWL